MTMLTTNFSLEELASYNFARAHGFRLQDGVPELVINELQITANLLQKIRDTAHVHFGKEIGMIITNAWRWKKLNDHVGSRDTSAHIWGGAADVVPRGVTLEEFFDFVGNNRDIMREVDQLICERGCVHVGRAKDGKTPRHELRGESWINVNGKMERHYPLIRIAHV